jgi:molecular chaperone GrpE
MNLFKNTLNKNNFVLDDLLLQNIKETESRLLSSDIQADLVSSVSQYLKANHKEPQTVYRLQHQKIDNAEELIVSLLPILDSLENLVSLSSQFADNEILKNWMTSIEGIYKRMKKILSKEGLQTIDSIGTLVDFSLHEVVEYRHTPDGISNLIIEEKQKGYMYKGKLIREAKVVVANADGGI